MSSEDKFQVCRVCGLGSGDCQLFLRGRFVYCSDCYRSEFGGSVPVAGLARRTDPVGRRITTEWVYE